MTTQPQTAARQRGFFDVLQVPLIGPALKHRYGRLIFQAPLLIAAAALVIDGFTGPQAAPRNLATIGAWVHYRGIVIVVLLLAGNLFCMGCPFTVLRTLARRLSRRGRRFPKALRGKWIAIGGLFLMFFLYEWLDLWASPLLTAWVIVGYFVASFVLEMVFTESAFCKYVCPLGTFNFVYATTAPTQIGVKNKTVCHSCTGKECVNGSFETQTVIHFDQIPGGQSVAVKHGPQGTLGCGTLLYPPQMTSNLDCVYCLDCVRACPHDNIGLMARRPGRELLRADSWPKRWDSSFLVITLAFMGLMNAFGMVSPVYALEAQIEMALGTHIEFPALLIVFAVIGLALPVGLSLLAAQIGRRLTRTTRTLSMRHTVAAFAPAFVPLGFGIWFAHYSFHFLSGPLTIIPVVQEFLGGTGDWQHFSGAVSPDLLGLIQIVGLAGGFLCSLIVAQRVALRLYKRDGVPGLLPWALLLLAMMLTAVWLFSLPMEMRGNSLFN